MLCLGKKYHKNGLRWASQSYFSHPTLSLKSKAEPTKQFGSTEALSQDFQHDFQTKRGSEKIAEGI